MLLLRVWLQLWKKVFVMNDMLCSFHWRFYCSKRMPLITLINVIADERYLIVSSARVHFLQEMCRMGSSNAEVVQSCELAASVDEK